MKEEKAPSIVNAFVYDVRRLDDGWAVMQEMDDGTWQRASGKTFAHSTSAWAALGKLYVRRMSQR